MNLTSSVRLLHSLLVNISENPEAHEATSCNLHRNISVLYMHKIEFGTEEAKFGFIPDQDETLGLAPVR